MGATEQEKKCPERYGESCVASLWQDVEGGRREWVSHMAGGVSEL